jgi:hypothetical protein
LVLRDESCRCLCAFSCAASLRSRASFQIIRFVASQIFADHHIHPGFSFSASFIEALNSAGVIPQRISGSHWQCAFARNVSRNLVLELSGAFLEALACLLSRRPFGGLTQLAICQEIVARRISWKIFYQNNACAPRLLTRNELSYFRIHDTASITALVFPFELTPSLIFAA